MNKKGIIFTIAAVFAVSALASAQGIVSPRNAESLQHLIDAYNAKEQDSKKKQTPETRVIKEMNDKVQKQYSAQAKANQAKKAAALSEKQQMEAKVAKIPAAEKARVNAMIEDKDYDKLAQEIRYATSFKNDELKYYALVETGKKDGKGLISFGTLKVAQAIINTSFDSRTYVVKVAKSYENAVHNSGKTL